MAKHEHSYEVLHVSVPSLEGADAPVRSVEGTDKPEPRRDETVELCRGCGHVKRRKPTADEREIAEIEAAR